MRRLHLTRRVCAGRERGARGAAVQEPRPRALERAAAQQQRHSASQSGSGRLVITSRPSRAALPVAHPRLQAACLAPQPFCSTAPAPSSQTSQTKPQAEPADVPCRPAHQRPRLGEEPLDVLDVRPHCHFCLRRCGPKPCAPSASSRARERCELVVARCARCPAGDVRSGCRSSTR